jgi:hypothetical protein
MWNPEKPKSPERPPKPCPKCKDTGKIKNQDTGEEEKCPSREGKGWYRCY